MGPSPPDGRKKAPPPVGLKPPRPGVNPRERPPAPSACPELSHDNGHNGQRVDSPSRPTTPEPTDGEEKSVVSSSPPAGRMAAMRALYETAGNPGEAPTAVEAARTLWNGSRKSAGAKAAEAKIDPHTPSAPWPCPSQDSPLSPTAPRPKPSSHMKSTSSPNNMEPNLASLGPPTLAPSPKSPRPRNDSLYEEPDNEKYHWLWPAFKPFQPKVKFWDPCPGHKNYEEELGPDELQEIRLFNKRRNDDQTLRRISELQGILTIVLEAAWKERSKSKNLELINEKGLPNKHPTTQARLAPYHESLSAVFEPDNKAASSAKKLKLSDIKLKFSDIKQKFSVKKKKDASSLVPTISFEGQLGLVYDLFEGVDGVTKKNKRHDPPKYPVNEKQIVDCIEFLKAPYKAATEKVLEPMLRLKPLFEALLKDVSEKPGRYIGKGAIKNLDLANVWPHLTTSSQPKGDGEQDNSWTRLEFERKRGAVVVAKSKLLQEIKDEEAKHKRKESEEKRKVEEAVENRPDVQARKKSILRGDEDEATWPLVEKEKIDKNRRDKAKKYVKEEQERAAAKVHVEKTARLAAMHSERFRSLRDYLTQELDSLPLDLDGLVLKRWPDTRGLGKWESESNLYIELAWLSDEKERRIAGDLGNLIGVKKGDELDDFLRRAYWVRDGNA